MQLHSSITSLAMGLALAMGLSTLAQASPHGDDRRGPPHHAQGPKHRPHAEPRWRHGQPPPPPPRFQGHRPPPPPAYGHYRGAGPQHRWVQGSRIPAQYRGPRYVVHDWRAHRLHQPPRGYQWVQYGGDYMLVAVASGVIAQLILSGMH